MEVSNSHRSDNMEKTAIQSQLLHYLQIYSRPGWGGADEEPVTEKNYQKALDLLLKMPDDAAVPQVYPEEDGTLNFVWYSAAGNLRIFVDDDLSWCGMISDKNHYSTFVNFDSEIPQTLIDKLNEITNEDQQTSS